MLRMLFVARAVTKFAIPGLLVGPILHHATHARREFHPAQSDRKRENVALRWNVAYQYAGAPQPLPLLDAEQALGSVHHKHRLENQH